MAPRAIFLPATVLLFCAFILSLIVSVSLPALPTVDIARVHFTSGTSPHLTTDTESINQIRFGIWAYCIYDTQSDERTCIDPGHGYTVELQSTSNNVTIGGGATRGLAVHPVATGVTFIALLFSLSSHVTLGMLATFLAFLSALLTLIAFAIDIALFAIVHSRVPKLAGVQVHTIAAPGLWITLATLILLLVAGGIGWLGRRRSRMADATNYLAPEKPGLFSRIRRF